MSIRADRRLCYTKDRSLMVEESDPRAAFLAYPAGRFIAPAEAERYGLEVGDGGKVLLTGKGSDVAATKSIDEPADVELESGSESEGEGKEEVPEWTLGISPADYLERYGDEAKNSELARAVIAASEG